LRPMPGRATMGRHSPMAATTCIPPEVPP
jgi:hypothetical protein